MDGDEVTGEASGAASAVDTQIASNNDSQEDLDEKGGIWMGMISSSDDRFSTNVTDTQKQRAKCRKKKVREGRVMSLLMGLFDVTAHPQHTTPSL